MGKQYIKTNSDGDKFYYKDPKKTILHRTDGPAVESVDGYKTWYLNGVRHRLDGPAVVYPDGEYKEWWVNDIYLFYTDEDGELIERMV